MPKIDEDKFIMTNDEHGDGVAVDIYNDKYSLVGAKKNEAGDVWMDWIYNKTKDGPSEKMYPLKITLGDRDEAILRLKTLINIIDGSRTDLQWPESEEEYNAGIPETQVTPDDDIPF